MKLITYIFLIIFIALNAIPLVYWFMNPDITSMQLLIKFWYVYISMVISAIFTILILKLKT